jgi:CheY-like chemotaxis protein
MSVSCPIADIAQIPACLIADVNMPAMTGIELYRHPIDAARDAYPKDVDRIRRLERWGRLLPSQAG